MAETAAQCVLAFDEKKEGNYSLPSYRQQAPAAAREIHYILPASLGEKDDDLEPSSLKMPHCGKAADELLLGLWCEKQDICFPDFEVGDEGDVVEKYEDECSYMKLINLNGMLDLESGCRTPKEDPSEESDEDCWSMAVNLEKEDLGSRSDGWFQAFVDGVVVKVDTGQNLRYCVQVFKALFEYCWEVMRSMFGYKEVFSF